MTHLTHYLQSGERFSATSLNRIEWCSSSAIFFGFGFCRKLRLRHHFQNGDTYGIIELGMWIFRLIFSVSFASRDQFDEAVWAVVYERS
jgi:hypothetical protein